MALMIEKDTIIDIESCLSTIKEPETPDVSNHKVGENTIKVCGLPMSVDDLAKCSENSQISPNSGKNAKKEKRFSMSAKKPPKPPRPPRGLSLDAADQKLIKEISELAMIKRARIERMRALKKMRAGAKASSGASSSSGNLIAMLFTVVFCIVVIFQGCHPLRILPSNSSTTKIMHSSTPNGANEHKFFDVVNQYWSSSTTNVNAHSGSESPSYVDRAPVLDNKDDANNRPFE
ncbi:hypothetical protein STAS_20856 [Striga asiatica]|uniref:Transmembrane protein n=1 Tax=Striga asiatica TaxID=4170 RepID=A0A5A7QGB6_STRAF|nr:hypothetical protein STAS_20856 [Striga asiatica]